MPRALRGTGALPGLSAPASGGMTELGAACGLGQGFPEGMTQRILIIGFSNVATTSGFSVPTADRLTALAPGLSAVRVGLGALMPQAIPPYLRLAADRLGPFRLILLEIASSAYSMHPLATEAAGRDILADILVTVQETGAEAAFLLHLRHWTRPVVLDFGGLIRHVCQDQGLPLLDLAQGWIDRHGASQVRDWLRDDTHTTAEGGAAMADEVVPFLQQILARPPVLPGLRLPRPVWRRGLLDLAPALSGWPQETHPCLDLPLDYVRLEGRAARIDLGHRVRAQGLVHLFHPSGGRVGVTIDPPGDVLPLTMIDPHSHQHRIGVLPFDFFRGRDLRAIDLSAPEEAPDIRLLKGERERPLRSYIGPLLTLEPDRA
jgi:hypothetical protein